MKKIKRFMSLILMVAAFLTVLPFFDDNGEAEAASKPKLSASSVTIAAGGTQTIKLKGGTGKWTITNKSIAVISKKSSKQVTVKPKKAGTTELKCKVGKKVLKCKIVVLNNKVGTVKNLGGNIMKVGEKYSNVLTPNPGFELIKFYSSDDSSQVTSKATVDSNGNAASEVTIKAVKPGRPDLCIDYIWGETARTDKIKFTNIEGFRGKTKAAKTKASYKAWRKRVISSMVKSDMTTWEIIDALGYLISTGKYSGKGGSTALQLWYGGNGTCWSGAYMMQDFMNDLGITNKVKFMGRAKGGTDVFGYTISYASQHKNTWIKLGGKVYELNPQPGFPWPIGTRKRSKL